MSFVGNLYGTIASVHHMRDHLQEAEINYKKALRFGCSKAEHIDRYGVLLMMQGRADEALEVYQKALDRAKKDPQRFRIRLNRAMCYLIKNDLLRATVALEDLHEKNRSARVYETLGYVYIRDGNLEKALQYNLEALDYDSNNATVLDNLTQTYLELGDYENAGKYARRAYELKDSQADILYHMGLIAEHEEKFAEAADYYKRASGCRMGLLNDVTPEILAQKLETLKEYLPAEE